jgi:hypothetical protein
MLLPDNIHPENTLFYNGGLILQVLYKNNGLDMLKLYQEVKQTRSMSFPVFILSLDWLYIANIAEVKNGRVELCS